MNPQLATQDLLGEQDLRHDKVKARATSELTEDPATAQAALPPTDRTASRFEEASVAAKLLRTEAEELKRCGPVRKHHALPRLAVMTAESVRRNVDSVFNHEPYRGEGDAIPLNGERQAVGTANEREFKRMERRRRMPKPEIGKRG